MNEIILNFNNHCHPGPGSPSSKENFNGAKWNQRDICDQILFVLSTN
jgi:hypothetical protein